MSTTRKPGARCRHVPGDVRCTVDEMGQEYAQCQRCGREIVRVIDAQPTARWSRTLGEPLLFAPAEPQQVAP